MGDLNLPFEPNKEPMPFLDQDFLVSGGVVVMASVVTTGAGDPLPALVFRFARAEGGFYPAVVLAASSQDLVALPQLIVQAVGTAINKAHETGRNG